MDCIIPEFAPTLVGVGALIYKDEKVLLIKEHFGDKDFYKIPGGYMNPGETFEETARRETLEEVGVGLGVCNGVVLIRHIPHFKYDYGDIYVIMEFSATDNPIKVDQVEIKDASWVSLINVENLNMRQHFKDAIMSNPMKSYTTTFNTKQSIHFPVNNSISTIYANL